MKATKSMIDQVIELIVIDKLKIEVIQHEHR